MRKLPLFLLFALVFLALSGQAVSGETFAPVDLYISGPPNGQLRIEEPRTEFLQYWMAVKLLLIF